MGYETSVIERNSLVSLYHLQYLSRDVIAYVQLRYKLPDAGRTHRPSYFSRQIRVDKLRVISNRETYRVGQIDFVPNRATIRFHFTFYNGRTALAFPTLTNRGDFSSSF